MSGASQSSPSASNVGTSSLCEQFMSITNLDRETAATILQQNGWDLQQAINAHFEMPSTEQYPTPTVASGQGFKLLSWNIDGLDEYALEVRAHGVVDVIRKEQPDAVFLQEVVPTTLDIIKMRLSEYDCHVGNTHGYFVVILTRRNTLVVRECEIVGYLCTQMGRNLLIVHATYKNAVDIDLMTTHHESGRDLLASEERMDQLKLCFRKMVGAPSERIVLFGGDLNMRQKELYQVGNIPPGICDLWAAAGQPRDCEYTWDMQLNTNKNFSSATNVPRARFDRLYYRPSANVQLRTNTFELRGLEKIPSVDRFCSDHWALLVRLQNE